ncbi:unnamed protein product [Parnassius apollo]|uniref:(apollo) hypothetical protein n=1 Tax=Parnassius apollo TaxID=110799 RepID=A0A8S3Y9W5_PARAO|nr:unnamed protein product [Parnassius apollo]
MDSIVGPSRTRKLKFVMNYAENDSDLERELFAESDSDDIYYPDYDEEQLSSEDDCQPSFSVTDISLPVQKLPRSSPSQSPPHHQDDDQTPDKPSAEESTSHWTSEGQNKLNLYDYRIRVISSLLPQKPSEPLPISTAGGSSSQHWIAKITDLTKKGRVQRKICRQCYKNKKRTDSPWHCIKCENKPGLCIECFDNYHRGIGN